MRTALRRRAEPFVSGVELTWLEPIRMYHKRSFATDGRGLRRLLTARLKEAEAAARRRVCQVQRLEDV